MEAAILEKWSNGPVEGQINRLKTLKRQMYTSDDPEDGMTEPEEIAIAIARHLSIAA